MLPCAHYPTQVSHSGALELPCWDDPSRDAALQVRAHRLLAKGPRPGFSFLEPAAVVAQDKRFKLTLGASRGAGAITPAPFLLPEVLEGERSCPVRNLRVFCFTEWELKTSWCRPHSTSSHLWLSVHGIDVSAVSGLLGFD